MTTDALTDSELILNPDGSVYHLNILPRDIADIIITVGDPDRVNQVSTHFDKIEVKKGKREFITHTGLFKGKRISVLSTGIGTDNIDIVLNELDALVNIDLTTRCIKRQLKSLKIIRIGTSGCLEPSFPVDSTLLSTFGLGFDGLLRFYNYQQNQYEQELSNAFQHSDLAKQLCFHGIFYQANQELLNHFLQLNDIKHGITTTCAGFYAPQGRKLRLQPKIESILDHLRTINLPNHTITNFEMETAGIYGLSNLLGHQALSVNLLIANRATGQFSPNPKKAMDILIERTLNHILTL